MSSADVKQKESLGLGSEELPSFNGQVSEKEWKKENK